MFSKFPTESTGISKLKKKSLLIHNYKLFELNKIKQAKTKQNKRGGTPIFTVTFLC